MTAARYAIYFSPALGSPWWAFGAGWLARDEARDADLAQAVPGGFTPAEFARLTSAPRRYGFHATLKAPFRLRAEVDEALLLQRLRMLAEGLRAVPLGALEPMLVDDFVALVPSPRNPAVEALAAQCVLELDDLRARLTADEVARRQPERLDSVGRELLSLYGYPHVLGRFRFHMTLSGPVDVPTAERILAAARPEAARLNHDSPPRLDRLCLFREAHPDAPFVRLHDEVLEP